MSFLEELFYGNLNPSQMSVKEGGEYDRGMIRVVEKIGTVREELTEDQVKLLDEIVSETVGLSSLAQRECFLRGFRLGAKMVWETEHPAEGDFS